MNIYFLLLLVMVILLYQGIFSSFVYAPKKIKILSTMALILMSFRYITLIILFIMENQSYLYFLKPAVFTNLLCIPVCGILSVSIFGRENKIKFKKISLVFAMLCIAYSIMIYKSSVNINISNHSGYTMELQLLPYCYMVFLIINTIIAFKGIELFNKAYSNKLGALLIIISSSVTLITVLLTSINANFPWVLLGDISWMVTVDYALIKLKR